MQAIGAGVAGLLHGHRGDLDGRALVASHAERERDTGDAHIKHGNASAAPRPWRNIEKIGVHHGRAPDR
jgi:hypothetical protein